MAEPTQIDWSLIFEGILALGVAVTFFDSRRQSRRLSEARQKEREKVAEERGAHEERHKQMENSLDHAHEKIRVMETNHNELNIAITKLEGTIQRNNEILEKVSTYMETTNLAVARIQERMKEM